MTRDAALAAVSAERDRQAALWATPHTHGQGDCSSPSVPLMVKIAVLGEEFGEVARAALDGKPDQMRAELTQLAAVSVAILEGLNDCTCYKGHRGDLDAISGPIANCAVHGEGAGR